MATAFHPRTYAIGGLAVGLLAGIAGAGLVAWQRWKHRNIHAQAPAAAFEGEGAHPKSPVHTRDAGPDNIRDENGDDWDALDQASDESFPSSDPPSTNDFRTPEPIDYSETEHTH
jgi:hypothetical protein